MKSSFLSRLFITPPVRQPRSGSVRKGLLVVLFAALGGVFGKAGAQSVGAVLDGSSVYINNSTSAYIKNYVQSSDLNNLSFKVLTKSSGSSSHGTVSVAPKSGVSLTGSLKIPSVIYYKLSSTYYAYDVKEIPASAFKDQTGITDVLFTRDNALISDGNYAVTTIGTSAFEGTTGLTGTVQIPRTVTSIGDKAFALTSSSSSTLANVVIGTSTASSARLVLGSDVFLGRRITNLHVMGNFGKYVTVTDSKAVFTKDNVENVLYYSDGTNDDYYAFLTSISSKNFGLPGKNLYLPSSNIKSFVEQCKDNGHAEDWLPETVNCLTFDHTSSDGSVYTFMLATNNLNSSGPQVALHAVKNLKSTDLTLDFNANEWDLELMPVPTGLSPDITIIDSRAFADNDNLCSITIKPNTSDDAITIMGNAFAGAKELRYVDLSGSTKFTFASGYSLSRIATTTDDESVPYKYTKSTKTYEYEQDGKTPFGGLPAYTLVYLPKGITSYSSRSDEAVYQVDGATKTAYTRSADENFVLLNADGSTYSCSNFGVYEVPDLDATTASGQKTWYSFLNAHDFTAANSKYYRQYAANVPGTVCLPFAPDATTSGVFRNFKSSDGSHVTLQAVANPQAGKPYFFYPSQNTTLTSATSQTIQAVTTSDALSDNNMYGTYAGMTMQGVSGGTAYGMASSAFTYNGKSYPAGTFVKFSSTAWLNPFRAYLLLSGSNAKAAVMETELDDTPTGITTVGGDKPDTTPYYNIQGMRESRPGKGLYIHNGEKVWLK